MLGLIVTLIIVGLIAGALARLIVPGRQHMSVVMTIVLGIVGSFVGGFLGFLLFHKDAQDGFTRPAGVLRSIVGGSSSCCSPGATLAGAEPQPAATAETR